MSDQSDIIDSAGVAEGLFLKEAQSKRKPTVKAIGYCNYCSTEVGSGEQFCTPAEADGPSCRDDWEAEQAACDRNHGPSA